MNTRPPLRTATLTVVAAATVAVALAGCNPGADAGPITSATKTPTGSSVPSPSAPSTSVPSTSTTGDAAAKEAQDRQAAELVWRRFNALILTVENLPANQVDGAINAVAVDPTAARMRAENTKFRSENKAGYGQVVPYVHWAQPISGKNVAVLNDCQDGSQAGLLDTKTGNKLTVGTPNTPIEATLQRTAQGWKVAKADIKQGATCTPEK